MKLRVDDLDVFVHTGGVEPDGRGPAIVLVHGAGQDHSIWAYQTRLLAGHGIPTFAVDLPGHGRSDGPALASIEEMSSWIERLLDAAVVDTALVVGHSMGSYVAIDLAASAPKKVVGLVLTGTSDRMPVHETLMTAAAQGDDLATELITGWTHSSNDRFGGNPSPGLWARGLTTRLLERSLGSSLGVALNSVANHDPLKRAAGVSCPVTVAVGRHDRMANPKGAARLAEAFAGGRLVEIPGGHGAMLDHPRGVASVILDSYRSISDAGA